MILKDELNRYSMTKIFTINMEISQDEYENYYKEITSFLLENSNISLSIKSNSKDINTTSLSLIDNNQYNTVRLALASIEFIIKNSTTEGNTSKSIEERLFLIAAFIQGVSITENAILEAQYIKAAAIMKQDYEIITRIQQVIEGKAIQGDNPNAKYAPKGASFVNGYLNDIAHISKIDVLKFYLGSQVNKFGIEIAPAIKEEQMKTFYLYFMMICVEINETAISLYKEIYEENNVWKKAKVYSIMIRDRVAEIKNSVVTQNAK